jgi:hypothetical protein
MGKSKRRKQSAQRRNKATGRSKSSSSSSRGTRQHHSVAREELGAESLTVMWMLTAVATLAAQLVALTAEVIQFFFAPEDAPAVARMLPNWFLFCAAVTGMVCLGVTPIVYVVRRRPPPTAITIATIVICVIPWLVLASKIGQ